MHKILTKTLALIFDLLLRVSCGTNRLSTTRLDILERYAEEGNNIFAFWHSRLFYLTYFQAKSAKRRMTVLVSMSRDGDYGTAIAHRLKQDVVRGSTSRGGLGAIRQLVSKVAKGGNIVITPDGPRGPAAKVNEGVIRLAQLTRARIIPVSYDATRKMRLKSWDRFIVVKPFGRVHIAFGEPIEVARDMTAEQVEQHRQNLENRLLELDRLCAEKLCRDGKAEAP
jgi:lysophospholipid acyltransferase (LPLAT)-like uncharacterized protein